MKCEIRNGTGWSRAIVRYARDGVSEAARATSGFCAPEVCDGVQEIYMLVPLQL